MDVAYISDTDPKFPIYRCSTAGVPMYGMTKSGRIIQMGSTTDHSDLYFVRMAAYGALQRCKPVDLGTEKRRGIDGKPETFHRWAFQIVPVVKRLAA